MKISISNPPVTAPIKALFIPTLNQLVLPRKGGGCMSICPDTGEIFNLTPYHDTLETVAERNRTWLKIYEGHRVVLEF